jgi:uncharacterized membrane protein
MQSNPEVLSASPATALGLLADDAAWRFLGRLHPLLVHFPIALLLVAAALTFLGARRERWASAVGVCLALGALGAVAAAGSGWLNAAHDSQPRSLEETLFWHRWCGVATAVLSVIAWYGARPTTRLALARRTSRPALLAAVATIVWGGHLGGELVYGEGYLLEVFERRPAPAPTPPADAPPVADPPPTDSVPPEPVAAGVDFVRDVVPILSGRCVQCHGPAKKKGNLRLDQRELVLGGDKQEWLVVPGQPDASELVRLVSLPADDQDRMPNEGEPLTAEQIATLREWITAGAVWPEGFVVPYSAPEGDAGGAEAQAAPVPRNAELGLDAAAALARLRERGAHAAPLAQGSAEVEVNLALADGADDAALALLAGLEEELVGLDLARTRVSDAGLDELARFTALRRLHLEGTAIGDAGLAHLAGLRRLEYLNLWGTRTSDAGLAHLAGLTALRRLYLWRTATTAQGVERLRAALPELTVVTGEELSALAPEPAPEPEPPAAEELPPCCAAARAAGGECDHPCCVEARAAGELCPRCKA